MAPPLRIHLIAACGTGMGALAGLLATRGHQVSGSDQAAYPPMSDQLRSLGVPVAEGYDPANVPADADLVVVGNAVSAGHPEVVQAQKLGLPLRSMPETLHDFFLKDRRPVVVAGTHGKTTVSALVAHVLQTCGRRPGYLIGGVVQGWGTGSRIGDGPDFVVEGDEYDSVFWDKGPKFLHYAPHSAALTSVEFDHADIYASLEGIQARFRQLVELVPPEGHLLVAAESDLARETARTARCRTETYGCTMDADWRAVRLEETPAFVAFTLVSPQGDVGRFRLPLAGVHNVRNAVCAVALAAGRGVDPAAAAAALATFPGVKRRQEVLGTAGGITVMDDFAHHPTAVRQTLMALHSANPDRRLWAIFEPRSATSCRRVFQREFEEAFDAAHQIVLAANFRAPRLDPEDRLDVPLLAASLSALGMHARYVPTVDQIVELLAAEARPGDLLCFLSNGGFGGVHEKVLARLRQRADATAEGRQTA